MPGRTGKKTSETPFKPTREEIANAAGKTVPDVIAPGLRVLFCGINPGLYTAAVGHHFARPGNRFWPALHQSGFTRRLLSPFEEAELLEMGLGITNVAARATATAAELSPEDFISGGRILRRKIRRFAPRFVAVLGLGLSCSLRAIESCDRRAGRTYRRRPRMGSAEPERPQRKLSVARARALVSRVAREGRRRPIEVRYSRSIFKLRSTST